MSSLGMMSDDDAQSQKPGAKPPNEDKLGLADIKTSSPHTFANFFTAHGQ